MATCTAPGVPSCTITCPNGCYAIYWHPTGTCTKGCNTSPPVKLDPTESFAVQISEMSAADVKKIFGDALGEEAAKALGKSKNFVSLSLERAVVADLAAAIIDAA